MGVFKNDVGRPTNKSIMIRNVLKGIVLIIVAAGLVCGGYYLNDYQKKNDSNNNSNANKTVKKDPYKKYKNVDFIRNTVVDDISIPLSGNRGVNKLEVIGGSIVIYITDDNSGKIIEKVDATGISSKVKYITSFNVYYFDAPIAPVAALTEDNKLYIGNCNKKTGVFNFKLFEKNIIDMVLTSSDSPYEDSLYLLTSDGNLKYVKTDLQTGEHILTKRLYENRYIFVGNYHEGGVSHLMLVSAKDNTVSFNNSVEDDVEKIKFTPIKYNNKNIIVKNVVVSEEGNYSTVYIVTNNDELLTTIKKKSSSSTVENCKDCYKFKKYNNLKVKNISYEYEDKDIKSATIVFDNGSTLKVGSYPHVYEAN